MSEKSSTRVNRTRFVTLCQQLLALAVVVAVLTPAARTISMDVRPMPLGGDVRADGPSSVALAAYTRAALTPSVVPAAPVDPIIKNYALTAPRGARLALGAFRAVARRTTGGGGSRVTTQAVPVTGYGAVGVTWAHGTSLAEGAISVQARTETGGVWSGWTAVEYHDDHGPDAGTAEARDDRPGTEPLFVGHVDRVQVRVTSKGAAPADLRLSVIDPGTAAKARLERPAYDAGGVSRTTNPTTDAASTTGSSDALGLSAATVTPKPQIYTRAQWGADESWRDKSSLHYGDVHAGFIHHTVQANDYTRSEVPGLIRADYAYHTQSRGWSDIGYNYLVDRFGRIWEGRYGGIDRDPVGAHTLGYNDDSFAASAIGNYDIHQPSAAMVQAYAALFAWKLALAGVKATATHQWVTKRYFNAINGHRDAGQTACPGKYLYAQIPNIRTMAANLQARWYPRNLPGNLAGSAGGDLVVRRAGDGAGFVVPINTSSTGAASLGRPIATGINLAGTTAVLKAGDWDGDGYGDLVVRRKADPQDLWLYRGRGNGTFAAATLLSGAFQGVQMPAAVGDWNGDGTPDLLGQPKGGQLSLYPGHGVAPLGVPYPVAGALTVRKALGGGLWTRDGAPDLLVRTSSSRITVYRGDGPGLVNGAYTLTNDISAYGQVATVPSVNGDGHPDLVGRDAAGQLWLLGGTTGTAMKARVPLGQLKGYDLVG
ncbi:FG-GAP-like repeat-containing protein [Nocardioides montaniterrae]